MKLVDRIQEHLLETARHRKLDRGDPGAWFKTDDPNQMARDALDKKREFRNSSEMSSGRYAYTKGRWGGRWGGVGPDASRVRDILAYTPDMPKSSILRAVKAGLTVRHSVSSWKAAGIPTKHIVGPHWKLSRDFAKTPKSPEHALSVEHHDIDTLGYDSTDSAPVSNLRRSFHTNLINHAMAAGLNIDDANSGRFMDTLKAVSPEPSSLHVKQAVNAHRKMLEGEAAVHAGNTLSQYFRGKEDEPELKGLPEGYREAHEGDVPKLASFCAKKNGCLARAIEGEFGDDHRPHRVVLSPQGHIVGLRKKVDGTGKEANAYHVPVPSMCTDGNNNAAPDEMAKFDSAKITHFEKEPVEPEEPAHRGARIPRSWQMRALRHGGMKISRTYQTESQED